MNKRLIALFLSLTLVMPSVHAWRGGGWGHGGWHGGGWGWRPGLGAGLGFAAGAAIASRRPYYYDYPPVVVQQPPVVVQQPTVVSQPAVTTAPTAATFTDDMGQSWWQVTNNTGQTLTIKNAAGSDVQVLRPGESRALQRAGSYSFGVEAGGAAAVPFTSARHQVTLDVDSRGVLRVLE